MYKKNKGFTIVELIVVMAIIAILVIMAVPQIQKYIKNAKLTYILATAETLHNAAVAYEADHITDPNLIDIRVQGYIDFSKGPTTPSSLDGTYISTGVSYLDPYIDGDILFAAGGALLRTIFDTEIYNIFYVGGYPMYSNYSDPIIVYYNDPRMPSWTEIEKQLPDEYDKFNYGMVGVIDGVPTVFNTYCPGSIVYHISSNYMCSMIPVSEYLEEYNKALKESNK